MADDVIIHGDFVQFNGNSRCEACQAKNLKCALQQNDEGCMACAGANRECFFSRSVVISGPKSNFDWNTLLNRNQVQTGVAVRTPASSVAFTPKAPLLENLLNEHPLDQPARDAVSGAKALPRTAQEQRGFAIPQKSFTRRNTPPENEDSRSRSGVDPIGRLPLGEILSLKEQTQEFDLAKSNARVGQWLDQCLPGSSLVNDSPTSRDASVSGQVEAVPESEEVSPDLSPEMQVDVSEDGNVPSTTGTVPRHDGPETLPAVYPGSIGGRPVPTLEAYPWTDTAPVPSLRIGVTQPWTANEAIVQFSQRAKATEGASRCASDGSHHGLGLRPRPSITPINPHPLFKVDNIEANRFIATKPSDFNKFGSPTSTSMPYTASYPQVPGYTPYHPTPPRLLPREPPKPTSFHSQTLTDPASVIMWSGLDPLQSTPPRPSRTKSIIDLTQGESKPQAMPQVPVVGNARVETIDPCDTFEEEIRESNPKLPDFLLKRLTQEQTRRYKRLIGLKIEHFELAQQEGCPSSSLCVEGKYYNGSGAGSLSGLELMKPSKPVQYSVGDREHSVDLTSLPPSYPLPPTQGLPSEFECPFCFKVKKCLKPSDWAKHFCEDLQPFVCTFDQCADPKSFKRKADWIRHENERHRQLERWVCNIVDCSHICYRKDNFVQHLVREHKMPEPKPRSDSRSLKVPYYGPSSTIEGLGKEDSVWTLVEECREEEPKSPKDEPCKFCGSVCNSWKKLSNHLAKHMEDVAFPVWKVILQTDVSGYNSLKSPISSSAPPPPPPPQQQQQPPLLVSSAYLPYIRQAPPSKNSPESLPPPTTTTTTDPHSTSSPPPPQPPTNSTTLRAISIPPAPPSSSSSIPHSTTTHFSSINKPYRCDEPNCTHDRGFATQTDLKRHRKGVHGIYDEGAGSNDQTFYRCQGRECKDHEKVWPRRDNFRGHLSRKHADEEIEELTERSTFRSTAAASPDPSSGRLPSPGDELPRHALRSADEARPSGEESQLSPPREEGSEG